MTLRAAYDRLLHYVLAVVLLVIVAAGLSLLRGVLDGTVVALLLLIPVGGITARWGLGPGITAALTAFLAFNYLFIAPYFTFTVHRPGDLGVLLVFLVVAVVMSQLVARAQAGARTAAAREREATQLYELSTALAGAREPRKIASTLGEQLLASLECQHVEIRLAQQEEATALVPSGVPSPERPPDFTTPIHGMHGTLGEIRMWRGTSALAAADERLVKTFAGHGALALERAALAEAEDRARILEESDRFKSSLLSSVSHDLRTPLATIKAAASSLRAGEVDWHSPARAELLAAIEDESDHLNMLVGNLLDMSRIESGALRPERRWNVLREIVQSVVRRTRRLAEEHELVMDVPDDLPLVPVDFVQMGQVFTNLISNSVKFAPANTAVRVRAEVQDDAYIVVQVSNQGPPVPEAHLQGIFDKFHRMPEVNRAAGTGLGLSICKGIVEAHGGQIWAENLPDGFAFKFTVPLQMDGEAPQSVPQETA
jgi:two-component system, OmpR family, sensor histidine kinase KdpD